MEAPMTPEMQQALAQQQAQQQVQQVPQQGMSTMAQVQQPMAPSEEDITQAKKMLGLDVMEANMKYEKSLASTVKEFPEIPSDVLESELKKIEEQDPSLANQIKTSETGMKMFARGLLPSIKPTAKPDGVTDDSTSSSQGGSDDDLETKVKNGSATKVEVGKYLGRFKTTPVKK